MRERGTDDAMTGWEVWLIFIFIASFFYLTLPHFLAIIASFLTLFMAQYLWHIGFFKANKYHSRKDEEIAKRIKASQLRLKKEERQRKERRDVENHEQL